MAKDKKSKLMQYISEDQKTKKDFPNSLVTTGKDVVLSGVAGGLAGALIGKPATLIGLVTNLAGHYTGSKNLARVGTGMIVGGLFNRNMSKGSLQGAEDTTEKIKNRAANFWESAKYALYIDKLQELVNKNKQDSAPAAEQVSGVDYYLHGPGDELEALEQEIVSSASEFRQQNPGAFREENEEDAELQLDTTVNY